MGWSESTISDLRDLTLATGFTFQNVEDILLFVYVKEGVKVCCTYSKPRVKKSLTFSNCQHICSFWLEGIQNLVYLSLPFPKLGKRHF